jgi:hypothetical protein
MQYIFNKFYFLIMSKYPPIMDWKLNMRYQITNLCCFGRRLSGLESSRCRGSMWRRAHAAVTYPSKQKYSCNSGSFIQQQASTNETVTLYANT